MAVIETDLLSLLGSLVTFFGVGWAAHTFLRRDKKSKKELKLMAEIIVKSGVFSNWDDVFEKKPELAKFMLDNPKMMELINNLTGNKDNG